MVHDMLYHYFSFWTVTHIIIARYLLMVCLPSILDVQNQEE